MSTTNEHGFAYLNALTDAISCFTDTHLKQNPDYFSYEGMNLAYSQERYLYFQCWQSDEYYEAYANAQDDKTFDISFAKTDVDRFLLEHLTGNNNPTPIPKAKLKVAPVKGLGKVLEVAGYYKNKNRAYLKEYQAAFNKKVDDLISPKKGGLLFVINHEKFLRYLLPVFSKMDREVNVFSIRQFEFSKPLPPNVKLFFLDSFELPEQLVENNPFFNTFYRWMMQHAHMTRMLIQHLQPTKVLIAEGNSPYDEMTNQAAKSVGVPIYCLQQGWGPVMTPEFRNMTYDRFLSWGNGFSEILQPFNPNQSFKAVGNHILHPPAETHDGNTAISFFLQSVTKLISVEVWQQTLDFIIWTADNFPQQEVWVREHPSHPVNQETREQLTSRSNIKLIPPKEVTLNEMLEQTFLSVAVYSSTILESIAFGVVPLIFNLTSMKRYFPDIASENAGIEVATLEEAKEQMKRIIEDDAYKASLRKGMLDFRSRYFHSFGDEAIANIINELEN